jgi:DNA-binding transcriptional MerR regulator
LALRTGVTQKALRYREGLDLLTPVRGGNGYRDYREADIRVVEVVRAPGRLGIPVDQSRPFLDCLGAGHEHPEDYVASMAAYRTAIAQLTERIAALAEMRDALVARVEHAALRAAAERPEEEQTP